jgi:hypothetical protein
MHQIQGHPSALKNTLRALRAQIYANTVRVGDLNTPLSPVDQSSR